ncbi:ABC transporter permease [Halorarius litoreus]|uniref:ABC transporter permease n=1 Tax=Halorarius litoreus TaxID=2962676 RepID=UPI0020CFD6E7|nr:ABC transporter permease [Halorarius litoreus]
MSTETSRRTAVAGLGRGAVVLVVVVVQLAAFALAQAAGLPTLYALFALGSSAALAVATVGTARGVVATVVGTGVLVGVAVLSVSVLAAALAPVVLAVAVALSGDEWVGAAAAALGTLLLVALGVPLLLFVARQDLGLVAEMALRPDVQQALFLSVYAPLVAALAALATGVPLAYLLSRGFAGQSLVESLVDLPLVVPHSVAGIIILFGLGRGGAFPELSVLGTFTGMVLAMVFVSAPFAVNAAREAFEAVDPRLEYAARSHGASPLETFRRVTLPLAARGVLTGGVLAWARAVSEFGAVAVVAYSVSFFYPLSGDVVTTQHAPVFIFNTYLTSDNGLARSGAVGILLLALSALLFVLVRWLAYDEVRRV